MTTLDRIALAEKELINLSRLAHENRKLKNMRTYYDNEISKVKTEMDLQTVNFLNYSKTYL